MNILAIGARIVLDSSGFKAGMREVQSSARTAAAGMAKEFKFAIAGLFGYGAFKVLIADTIKATNRIKDLSEQFSITTDEVQQLDKAAKEVGGDGLEAIGQALIRLTNARADATSNDKLLALFNKYGISLNELKDPTLRTVDLMKRLGVAMREAGELGRADATDLFGRGGQKILTTLQEFEKQGPIKLITQEDIDRIDSATEKIEELKRVAQTFISRQLGMIYSGLGALIKDFGSIGGKIENRNAIFDAFNLSQQKPTSANSRTQTEFKTLYENLQDVFSAEAGGDKDQISAAWTSINSTFDALANIGAELTPALIQFRDRAKKLVSEPEQQSLIPSVMSGFAEVSDATRQKYMDEREKIEKEIADTAFKIRLQQAESEFKKRAILAGKLAEIEDKARQKRAEALGMAGTNEGESLKAENEAMKLDIEAMQLRAQMESLGVSSSRGQSIDVSNLTNVGQLTTGRNVIGIGSDPVTQELKAQTRQATETNVKLTAITEQLRDKIIV